MHKQYKSLKDLDLPSGCTRTQPSKQENMHVYKYCLVPGGTYIPNPAYAIRTYIDGTEITFGGTDLTYCGNRGKGSAWCKSCIGECQMESQQDRRMLESEN